MEELRRAAVAYYNNSSKEMQRMAWNFFQSMDLDGDGRVNLAEFSLFLDGNGYVWVDRNWFHHLDADRDGRLNFWEVLTFYYVIKTRGVWCARCRTQLLGLYFTCVECFDAAAPFDLCSDCYSRPDFHHHHHGLFLDSYVLLRSKLGPRGEDVNMAITQPPNGINLNPANYGLTLLDVALSVANIATTLATGCSIM